MADADRTERAIALERAFRAAGVAGDVAVWLTLRRDAGGPEAGADKRRRDFLAGREAARRCLDTLGEAAQDIGQGTAREPLWPAGLAGSIAHTAQVAAAAVCRTPPGAPMAIGIDTEPAGSVGPELHDTLFTPSERSWLGGLDPAVCGPAATCLFSAKEALYKAQFPLTRTFVDFPEVCLSPVGPFTPDAGTWALQHGGSVLERFRLALFHRRLGGHVFTGCVAQVVAK